ncbi:hypothetical protein A1O1_03103 [Capronia coronata CBS 617.96]|uniref:Uncharacterized protein n=1 Tax=Capronia coronata CBS 617.96 TaxID=1182541 RepID=W9YZH7_9EURO|nr:uncharacterized protein A1O1_03103 [Capronia coronata CBS 617.96]EXJ94706.1 hypothetical protein A1O1_03103 [Capronia coronata CBS 617.96]
MYCLTDHSAVSESRVGKVVGKRRKRPVEESIGSVHLQTWVVNTTDSVRSIPSPANTQGSEESNKRHCDPLLDFDGTTDSFDAVEMANNRSFSMTSDLSFFPNSGLPTPILSPPRFTRYLSPSQPQARSLSTQASAPVDPDRLHPPSYTMPLARSLHAAADDEETVCIKLLAHLKRHGRDESQPRETQIELLRKCNAAVRRILRSKAIRSDYNCQLLLSNIMSHLARLCERLCDQPRLDPNEPKYIDSEFLQDQLYLETAHTFFDSALQQQQQQQPPPPPPLTPPDHEMMAALIKDVLYCTSSVGDMLKKEPLEGFQMLGRHEAFQIELEQRLKRAMALVSSSGRD